MIISKIFKLEHYNITEGLHVFTFTHFCEVLGHAYTGRYAMTALWNTFVCGATIKLGTLLMDPGPLLL